MSNIFHYRYFFTQKLAYSPIRLNLKTSNCPDETHLIDCLV
ncbi:hypothetical protein [Alysiella crassa]|nr:hypothetical protein [Alysiella crassa]